MRFWMYGLDSNQTTISDGYRNERTDHFQEIVSFFVWYFAISDHFWDFCADPIQCTSKIFLSLEGFEDDFDVFRIELNSHSERFFLLIVNDDCCLEHMRICFDVFHKQISVGIEFDLDVSHAAQSIINVWECSLQDLFNLNRGRSRAINDRVTEKFQVSYPP